MTLHKIEKAWVNNQKKRLIKPPKEQKRSLNERQNVRGPN
jgi:hypothetical protein